MGSKFKRIAGCICKINLPCSKYSQCFASQESLLGNCIPLTFKWAYIWNFSKMLGCIPHQDRCSLQSQLCLDPRGEESGTFPGNSCEDDQMLLISSAVMLILSNCYEYWNDMLGNINFCSISFLFITFVILMFTQFMRIFLLWLLGLH